MVFDACRSVLRVPFKTSEKGFSRPPETPGMFIAFSTSPQTVASDEGQNGGPYAKALASELRAPGIDHLKMFQEVKQRVFDLTHGAQRPWDSNDLLQTVYFNNVPSSSSPGLAPATSANPGTVQPAATAIPITGKPETFCTDLKAAADMAVQQFAALRRGAGDQYGWPTDARLFGYQSCRVAKGDRNYNYFSCDTAFSTNKEEVQKLAARQASSAANCLGNDWQKGDLSPGVVALNQFGTGNSIIISARDLLTVSGKPSYFVNINVYNSKVTKKDEADTVAASIRRRKSQPSTVLA